MFDFSVYSIVSYLRVLTRGKEETSDIHVVTRVQFPEILKIRDTGEAYRKDFAGEY